MRAKGKEGKEAFKYARIKTDLQIQILEGRLRPHDQLPSLNEITLKYKVSKITARRVLNDLVTEGLAYTSPGRGSFVADPTARLAGHKSSLGASQLGVVFEHASGSFMGDIIQGIDEEAFSRGVQISLCISNNSYEREAENLQRLANQNVHNILLFMVLQNDDQALNPNVSLYLRLQEQGIRLLLLDCHIPGFPIPSITYDDYNSFRGLVQFVKGKGCRRLAFVTRVINASSAAERLRGFKDGLLEHGLPFEERRMIRVRCDSLDSLVSDAETQTRGLFKGPDAPDAILCSDEMIAGGVFGAMDKSGTTQRQRPVVGGMGTTRNLHVLKGHPYVMLENDTHRLGCEAARMILQEELPQPGETNLQSFRKVISVPLRVPRTLR